MIKLIILVFFQFLILHSSFSIICSDSIRSEWTIFISANIAQSYFTEFPIEKNAGIGMGFEFRSKLGKSDVINSATLGFGIEYFASNVIDQGEKLSEGQYIFSIPIGYEMKLYRNLYFRLFTSVDFPFLRKGEFIIQGEKISHTSSNAHILNLNLGGGMALGTKFMLNSRRSIMAEIKLRATGLVAARSNDYWVYHPEEYPYIFGINIGTNI